MDRNYLLILLLVLVVATAAILLLRRSRAAPPAIGAEPDAVQVDAAEGLIDPITAVPPELVGVGAPGALAPDELVPPVDAGPPDRLTLIKGLGPKAAAQLGELGITRYDQLAALSGARLAAIDARMGAFQGRIARDRWVAQAGHLAAGDTAGFEAKFGKLGG